MLAISPAPMLLLFLLFTSTLSSQSLQQSVSETQVYRRNYDFFYFVQQWQISICNLKPCLKPGRPVFSIYGFWPSCFSRSSNCRNGTVYDPTKISDLKDDLDREWPSLQHEENQQAWKLEWESHGKCSETLLNQHTFFKSALKLKKDFDLFHILANKAILPMGEVYGLDNITDAIKATTGHTPQVGCSLYKQIPLLSTIFLCFDRNAVNIIDCPNVRRCTHEAIVFPFDLFGPSKSL